MAVNLTDRKLKLIEELGIHFEKSGMQPAPARIFALLMISDPSELTFDEIQVTLNLSKSAVSNAINLLINTSQLEYLTRFGERKRYFRCKVKSLKEGIERSLNEMEIFNSLLKQVLAERSAESKELNLGLKSTIGFLDFLRVELPILFEKWERKGGQQFLAS